MNRRRCILLSAGIGVACLGIVLGVLAMLPPQPSVTKANFDRIEIGMTLADVEELFGGQGRKFGTITPVIWHSSKGLACIHFSDSGCVSNKEWRDIVETLPGKFRRWLHLPK